MGNEISLEYIWKIFKAAWWKILIIAIVFAIAASVITSFIPDKYSSSISFYISNVSVTTEYTTEALLSAADYLANDYVEIILGDKMITEIISMLSEKQYELIDVTQLTPKDVRSMISSATAANTSIFEITVTCEDAQMAEDVCKYIELYAPARIKEIARPSTAMNIYYKDSHGEYHPYENQLECVSVVRSATKAAHVSPVLFTNVVIGAALGALLSFLYLFLRKAFDTTIRGSRDIKEITKKPILAEIPDWALSDYMQKYV